MYCFICNIASGLIEVKAKVGRPQCKIAIAVKRPVDDVRTAGTVICHLGEKKDRMIAGRSTSI
jgi:hypothetical protein